MTHDTRGHAGIVLIEPSYPENVGSMIRSAGCFDIDYVATIGRRYGGETTAVGHDNHVPVWHFSSVNDLLSSLPYKTAVVAVDYDDEATAIGSFDHPERALYVLGEEGPGFDRHGRLLDRADETVYIPAEYCLNVATAGSIVLADRYAE